MRSRTQSSGSIRESIVGMVEGDKMVWPLGMPLYLLSLLYGQVVRRRLSLYTRGVFSTKALPCKVISVGNITVGGSGKTPMTILLARYLKEKGCPVAVISRGYGGTLEGTTAVVSDGERVLCSPEEAGDEPYLMARKMKDVPVVVGADRYSAGLAAIRRFDPRVIILDDGFQHIRLKRDLNILLIDSSRGFGNGHLLPRGILREPLDGVGRADLVMIKGGEMSAPALPAGLPTLTFTYKPGRPMSLQGESMAAAVSLEGKKVIALAAIANPSSFIRTLKECGAEICSTLFFPDHHRYRSGDVDRIRSEVDRLSGRAEVVVTTEKDGVKLEKMDAMESLEVGVWTLPVDVAVDDWKGLDRVMDTLIDEAPR